MCSRNSGFICTVHKDLFIVVVSVLYFMLYLQRSVGSGFRYFSILSSQKLDSRTRRETQFVIPSSSPLFVDAKKKKTVTKSIPDPTKKARKKSGKKSKSKTKSKDLTYEYYKYGASLVGFAVVGFLLRRSWVAQAIFTATFAIYIYWLACKFDKLKRADIG